MESYKECHMCSRQWSDREEFLCDPEIEVVGYQANFVELEKGLFIFNHTKQDCGNSLAIEAREFTDLHDGPMFKERKEDEPDCPGYCYRESSLDPCPQECECAYVRDILQKVKSGYNCQEQKNGRTENVSEG